jgi:hypothetical protein
MMLSILSPEWRWIADRFNTGVVCFVKIFGQGRNYCLLIDAMAIRDTVRTLSKAPKR